MEIFSDRLRWLRERKGYSQQFMAEKLGISQPYYGRIERNKGEVNLEALAKLPELLGESTDFLLGITDYTKKASAFLKDFEEASAAVEVLRNDLAHLLVNPNSSEIFSKDFNPNDPQSVQAKIESIQKNLPFWESRFKGIRDKLLLNVKNIPHVKPETIAEIESGPWALTNDNKEDRQ